MNLFTLYKISLQKYIWLYLFVFIFPPSILGIPLAVLWLETQAMKRTEQDYKE